MACTLDDAKECCANCDRILHFPVWTRLEDDRQKLCDSCRENEKKEIRRKMEEKDRKMREERKMQEKQDSTCKHTEDVCQHCLEKVETTKEDSPPPKQTLPFGSKLLLTSAVSAFLVASGALWLVNTKAVLTAAKMAVKLISCPTE